MLKHYCKSFSSCLHSQPRPSTKQSRGHWCPAHCYFINVAMHSMSSFLYTKDNLPRRPSRGSVRAFVRWLHQNCLNIRTSSQDHRSGHWIRSFFPNQSPDYDDSSLLSFCLLCNHIQFPPSSLPPSLSSSLSQVAVNPNLWSLLGAIKINL